MNGSDMFKQMLNDATQSTISSAHIIGQSMKEVCTRYNQIHHPIKVKYKNWQGETSIRTIIPAKVHFGHTDYHTEDQWLLDVWDADKNAPRTYALMDIIEFIREKQ